MADADSAEAAIEEVRGESFKDGISEFVNSDIDEMISYRNLVRARDRWSAWATRLSYSLFVMIVLEVVFTAYFAVHAKMLGKNVSLVTLLATFSPFGLIAVFTLVCAGVILHCHGQISKYRDKIL